jgi:DNA-binding response OmpR family regulator
MNHAADSPHVLIVDDNHDASEVLALLVEEEGFSTETARTVAEARESIVRRHPAMVLLDLHLPDASGMKLLAELKDGQATAGIDVVILSGMLDDALKEEAHLLGAAAFLVKPLEPEQLTQVLDRIRR